MKSIFATFALLIASVSAFADKVEREQIMSVTQAEFRQEAENEFVEYMTKLKADKLYIEPTKRSQAIFNRIKAKTIKDYPQAKTWNWAFFGDESLNFNAIGGIYGKVVLGSYLFNSDAVNDDELAFVIAHEIAHSIRDHAREKYDKYDNDNFVEISHAIEYEADQIAFDLVKKAGFNHQISLGYLYKLSKIYSLMQVKQGGDDSEHPSIDIRYSRLNTISKN